MVSRASLAIFVLGCATACTHSKEPAPIAADQTVAPSTTPEPSATPSTTRAPFSTTTPPVADASVPHSNAIVVVLQASIAAGAKDATMRVAAALGPNDLFGVVSFASEPTVVVKLRAPDDPSALEKAIDAIPPKPGTEYAAAVGVARADLRAAHVLLRYVLLVTGGKNAETAVDATVKAMFTEGIGLSAFGVGASADGKTLARLASIGRGRYYAVASIAKLAPVVHSEVMTVLGP